MRFKSETHQILKDFIQLIKTQFNKTIKQIRTDNGMEFTSIQTKKLFSEHGIIHQLTCPYTPQPNGRVERKHRDLPNIARALKIQASIPIKFWGLCILSATYIMNRLPSTSLENKTPFQP